MQRAGRWLTYCLGLLLPLVAIAFGAVQILYRWNVQPLLVSAQSQQSEYLTAILEDIDFLAKVDLLRETSDRHADAGRLLNPRLIWAPLPSGIRLSGPVQAVSLVPNSVREALLRLRNEWIEKSFQAKRMKADLSFFKDLHQYDYWDIETASPIEDLATAGAFVSPSKLPIPDVNDLLAASKLRLMLGAEESPHEAAALQALKDVRQLAALLLTTENMQLVLAGLVILDEERTAYRHYVDQGFLTSDAWTSMDRNVTRRARRAMKANTEYLKVWTDPKIISQIFLEKRRPSAFCATGNEAITNEESLRPILKPQWPFEIDTREGYASLHSIYERGLTTCRWRYLRSLMKTGNFDADIPAPLILSHLPYSRKVFGLRLSLLGAGAYEGYR